MKYFSYFPKIDYLFQGKEYEMIDIFRTNYITLEQDLKTEQLINDQFSIENTARSIFDDPNGHWIISTINNINSKSEIPQFIDDTITETVDRYKRKKSYFFKEILSVNSGNFIIKAEDFETFSITGGDPYAVVYEYNPTLRNITVIENGTTFAKHDTLIFLKLNEQKTGFDIVPPPQGVSLEKIEPWTNTPIGFIKNNIDQNPYTNVSGSGITAFSPNSTGITFAKTLLYSYMIDGISHSSYSIKNVISEIKTKDNIYITLPNKNILNSVLEGTQTAFDIENSSRVWNINIGQDYSNISL